MRPYKHSGVIKNYYSVKGYGFIRTFEGAEQFFHIADCSSFEPKVGLMVYFEIGQDPKGRTKAIEITLTEERSRHTTLGGAI